MTATKPREQPRDALGRYESYDYKVPRANLLSILASKAMSRGGQPQPSTQVAEGSQATLDGHRYVLAGPTGIAEVIQYGKHDYTIPVDESGHIPHEFLIQRYFSVDEGKGRNTVIDSGKDAKVVFRGDMFRPEDVIQWLVHPNRYDIEGIDTEGSPGKIWHYDWPKDGPITVSNAYGNQAQAIMVQLKKHFTPREIATLSSHRDHAIVIGKPRRSAGGMYDTSTNNTYVDPASFNRRPHSFVHEEEHALRYNDKTRKGVATRSMVPDFGPLSDQDRTLEEAATELGTIGRLDEEDVDLRSYYSQLDDDPRSVEERVAADKRLLTGGGLLRRLRGRGLEKAVERSLEDSAIGGLKLRAAALTAKEHAARLKGNG